jgi:hypothetical protein
VEVSQLVEEDIRHHKREAVLAFSPASRNATPGKNRQRRTQPCQRYDTLMTLPGVALGGNNGTRSYRHCRCQSNILLRLNGETTSRLLKISSML